MVPAIDAQAREWIASVATRNRRLSDRLTVVTGQSHAVLEAADAVLGGFRHGCSGSGALQEAHGGGLRNARIVRIDHEGQGADSLREPPQHPGRPRHRAGISCTTTARPTRWPAA